MKLIVQLIAGTLALAYAGIVFAHGGDQRVVDGIYLVNLSRVPITSKAGDPSKFLISFLDLKKNTVVDADMLITLRIAKLDQVGSEPQFIFETQKPELARHGALEYSYVFAHPGFYEIYIDFADASQPEKIFHTPDFLIEVQKPEQKTAQYSLLSLGVVALLSICAGYVIRFAQIKK